MSRSFNGTTDYLSYAGAVDTGHPMSFALWFNKPNTTFKTAFSISNTNVSNPNRNSIVLSNTPNVRAFSANSGGATTASAISTANYSTNTWHHACAVFSSNSSRTIYLDGGNSATNTTAVSVNTVSFVATTIGGFSNSGSIGQPCGGMIAEVAVWNGNLTADDAATLAKGISPLLVRPAILVAYWPLYGNASPEVELRNRYEMTVNGTTKDVQPRIFLPSRGQYPQIVISNVTVSVTGESLTTTLGSVTAAYDANVALTGESLTTTLDSVSVVIGLTVAVTGEEISTTLGSVTALYDFIAPVTGESATTTLESVTAAYDFTATVTGETLTTTLGDVTTTQNTDATLTGEALTTDLGSVTAIFDATVAITGLSASLTLGSVTLALDIVVDLTALSAATELGDVTAVSDSTVIVTGEALATTLESVISVIDVEYLLTGFSPAITLSSVTAQTSVSSLLAQTSLGSVTVWGFINDGQNPNWTPVIDTQGPSWGPIIDAQSSNWTPIE
jgi:hypothetical protein